MTARLARIARCIRMYWWDGCTGMARESRPLIERFHAKVEIATDNGSDCWRWIGALHNRGYGVIKDANKRQDYAHRVSYELFVGPIPDGLVIDHLCENRWCVNPDHLEPCGRHENIERSKRPRAPLPRRRALLALHPCIPTHYPTTFT